jgi:hypothetical protein
LEVPGRQRHDANRRHKQSEPGRECHRRCQQRYRSRASQPVTVKVSCNHFAGASS